MPDTRTRNSNSQEGGNGKKPKIAILHYTAPPIISGVELLIKHQARMFREFNYKVSLLVGNGKQFRKDISVDIIHRMDSTNKFVLQVREELDRGVVSQEFKNLESYLYKRLYAYITTNQINVCIVHNILTRHYNLPLTSALVRLSHDLPQVRFVAWVHDMTFSDTAYTHVDKNLAKTYPWNLLVTPQENWQYVCISEFRKNELLQTFEKKPCNILVIPNGIDIEKFFGLSPQIRKFYNEIDGPSADYISCIPVRIVKRKNLELAIHIIHAMLKKGLHVKLVITANIDHHQAENKIYYEDLKKLVTSLGMEQNVFFLAEYLQKINHEIKKQPLDVRELYQISDFLLMTSAIEGFGLPIIEAGLMRVPIFASNIPPFHEIGETNINYFSLNDNPQDIAGMITTTLQKFPQTYFYRKVIKNYSLKRIFEDQILPLVNNMPKHA